VQLSRGVGKVEGEGVLWGGGNRMCVEGQVRFGWLLDRRPQTADRSGPDGIRLRVVRIFVKYKEQSL